MVEVVVGGLAVRIGIRAQDSHVIARTPCVQRFLAGHLAGFVAVFIHFDLPVPVVRVPDIGHDLVGGRVGELVAAREGRLAPVHADLEILRQPRGFVVPVLDLAAGDVVDAVTVGGTVDVDGRFPPGAADGTVDMFVDVAVDIVLGGVWSLVRIQSPRLMENP